MSSPARHVVIVGAGFAGVSAARRCADLGLKVTLCETARRPGGRASSFHDSITGLTLDNGQHLLASPYHQTFDLLRALGTCQLVEHQQRFEVRFVSPGERWTTLASGNPAFGRVALLVGLLTTDHLSLAARLSVLRAMISIRGMNAPAHKEITIDRLLAMLKQSPESLERFWHPVVLAVMNNNAAQASAELFITVVRQLFFDAKYPAALVVPRVGLADLITPIAEYLYARGSSMRYGTRVTAVRASTGGVCGVDLAGGGTMDCDAAILACNAQHAKRLVDNDLQQRVPFIHLDQFEPSPIVSVYCTFDRTIVDYPILGCIDSPIHWIFDRRQMLGGDRGDHQTVCLVTSAATRLADRHPEEIYQFFLNALHDIVPRSRSATVLAWRVIREKRATFVCSPEAGQRRPAGATPVRGLVLAGDWTDTGLPATIEGACVSGVRAAELLCSNT
jgi:squalene-associated FAD-dependent desaturase